MMLGFVFGWVVGVFVGWILLEKPEWARTLDDKVKGWIFPKDE